MTDRELLEAAAKAAGVKLAPTGFALDDATAEMIEWNPLTDDGDALRLAVACGVSINFTKTNIIVRSENFYRAVNRNTLRKHKTGELEALREYIVRAAAAIGSAECQ